PRPPPSTLFPYTTLFRSVLLRHVLMFVNHVHKLGTEIPQDFVNNPVDSFPKRHAFDFHHQIIEISFKISTEVPTISCVQIDSKRSEEHTSELQSRENLVC